MFRALVWTEDEGVGERALGKEVEMMKPARCTIVLMRS
jgi:hypothetical protein